MNKLESTSVKDVNSFLSITSNHPLIIAAFGNEVKLNNGDLDIKKASAKLKALTIEGITAFNHSIEVNGESSTSRLVRRFPVIEDIPVMKLRIYSKPREFKTIPRGTDRVTVGIFILRNNYLVPRQALEVTEAQLNNICLDEKVLKSTFDDEGKPTKESWEELSAIISGGRVKAMVNILDYKIGDIYYDRDNNNVGICNQAWTNANVTGVMIDYDTLTKRKVFLDSATKEAVLEEIHN